MALSNSHIIRLNLKTPEDLEGIVILTTTTTNTNNNKHIYMKRGIP